MIADLYSQGYTQAQQAALQEQMETRTPVWPVRACN